MPIYEYGCGVCGHRLETLQKMHDAPLNECPACKAPTLRKLMSVAGVRVKGSSAQMTSAEPHCGAGACPACLPD
jgi:putative FmdB family regulatory protein